MRRNRRPGYVEFHSYNTNFRKPYGFWNFIFDVFMVFITGGLWFIWIFVREMRGR